MSALGLSARDRRTLAVGGSVIVALFAIARGLPALRAWETERRAEAASVADRLALARAGARQLPALRDTLRARRERLAALDSALLGGQSPAAAAAELASLLEDVADQSKVKISALQLRSDSVATSPLSRVAVRITGVADVAGLAGFLRAVEGGETPLVVRELMVSQPEPAAPATKAETLRIDVLVEGAAMITPGVRP